MYNFKVDDYHVQPQTEGYDEYEIILFQGSNVIDTLHAKSLKQAHFIGRKAKSGGLDSEEIDPWYS